MEVESAGAATAVAGFRVRSGRAIAVLVAGSRDAPEVVQRREIALSDPEVPGSGQPYHASFGTLESDEQRLASRIAAVHSCAERSVTAAREEWLTLGIEVVAAVLVVGTLAPPEAIANEHIRAHALEGKLFRTALADALAA